MLYKFQFIEHNLPVKSGSYIRLWGVRSEVETRSQMLPERVLKQAEHFHPASAIREYNLNYSAIKSRVVPVPSEVFFSRKSLFKTLVGVACVSTVCLAIWFRLSR
jgi:hypothetical protein